MRICLDRLCHHFRRSERVAFVFFELPHRGLTLKFHRKIPLETSPGFRPVLQTFNWRFTFWLCFARTFFFIAAKQTPTIRRRTKRFINAYIFSSTQEIKHCHNSQQRKFPTKREVRPLLSTLVLIFNLYHRKFYELWLVRNQSLGKASFRLSILSTLSVCIIVSSVMELFHKYRRKRRTCEILKS